MARTPHAETDLVPAIVQGATFPADEYEAAKPPAHAFQADSPLPGFWMPSA